MEKSVGIQLYMVRDYLKNEQQISETLEKIAAAGYDGVELCKFLMADMRLWKSKMQALKLKTIAIHEVFEDLYSNIEDMVKMAEMFETKYLVSAAAMKVDFENSSQVLNLAKNLNDVGKYLKERGLTLLYHNHNCEFVHTDKGVTAMELVLEYTDPEYVKFEVDTFWIVNSGDNAMKWMDKIGKRIEVMHINDCGVCSDEAGVPIRAMVGKELGTGNLELSGLIEKAVANGCISEVLETHDNWIHGSPFESMEISRKYLKKYFK